MPEGGRVKKMGKDTEEVVGGSSQMADKTSVYRGREGRGRPTRHGGAETAEQAASRMSFTAHESYKASGIPSCIKKSGWR